MTAPTQGERAAAAWKDTGFARTWAEDHIGPASQAGPPGGAGFDAAGITDVEVVWRAFVTCLFMGRTSA